MFSLIKGDLEPDMVLTAKLNDVAQDLTTATTINMKWIKPDGTESTVALTAVTLASGIVKRVWVAGDTDMVGYHRGRIVVTWPGAENGTFPNDGSWFIWAVYKATGPT